MLKQLVSRLGRRWTRSRIWRRADGGGTFIHFFGYFLWLCPMEMYLTLWAVNEFIDKVMYERQSPRHRKHNGQHLLRRFPSANMQYPPPPYESTVWLALLGGSAFQYRQPWPQYHVQSCFGVGQTTRQKRWYIASGLISPSTPQRDLMNFGIQPVEEVVW